MIDLDQIEKEIKEAINNGPSFGNSSFQTNVFNVGNHQGQARSYRQVLLELDAKFYNLKKAKSALKKLKTEIRILVKKLENEQDEDQCSLIECDIEDKETDLNHQEKLVLDAITDANQLYSAFKSMPKFTKDEFEKQEQEYWKKRLSLDAQLSILSTGRIESGLANSLLQVGLDPVALQVANSLVLENKMKKIAQEVLPQLIKKEEDNKC